MRNRVEFDGPGAAESALEVAARVRLMDPAPFPCDTAWAHVRVLPILRLIDDQRDARILSRSQAIVLRAVVMDEARCCIDRYIERLVATNPLPAAGARPGTQDRAAALPPPSVMG